MSNLRHPSDEELLRHLDGESEQADHKRVDAHLRQCWKCRTRAAGIQGQIHSFTSALQSDAWPSADHQDLAHRKLRAVLLNATAVHDPPTGAFLPGIRLFLRSFLAPRRAAWIPMSLAMILIAVGVGTLIPSQRGSAPEWLAIPHAQRTALAAGFIRWEISELARHSGEVPLRGEMRIRITDRARERNVDTAKVEWISDAVSGRSAMRWLQFHGSIRLASWQPSPGRRISYTYQARRWGVTREGSALPVVAPIVSVLHAAEIEDAVFAWAHAFMARHQSPAQRLADLASQPRANLWSRADGKLTWTCVSMREGEAWLEDCLRADTRLGSIVGETIRLSSPLHDVEIEIPWASVYEDEDAMATLVRFLPPGLERLDEEYASLGTRSAPSLTLPQRHERVAPALPWLIDAEETLHHLEISYGSGMVLDFVLLDDAIRVTGLVGTAERRDLAKKAFAESIPAGYLDFDVRSHDVAALPPIASVESVGPTVNATPLAVQLVTRRFPERSAQEVRDFCNRAVHLSGLIVAESTSLAKMASRYPPTIEQQLSVTDLKRLDVLRRARAMQLHSTVDLLRQHLDPLGVLLPDRLQGLEAAARLNPLRWQEWSATRSASAQRVNADILALFAISTDLPAEPFAHLDLIFQRLDELLAQFPEQNNVRSGIEP